MRFKRDFFNRSALVVARELLGKYLVRRIGRKTITGMITETEAYCGPKDRASHASKGLTPRTKIMFGPPGFVYVYMIYGVHHCFNIVTEREGYPAAVLVRGVQIAKSQSSRFYRGLAIAAQSEQIAKLITGPGRVCREFKIDRKLNGVDLCGNRKIWIEDRFDKLTASRGEKIRQSRIKRGKRIGVDYAGKWKDKLWRFWV